MEEAQSAGQFGQTDVVVLGLLLCVLYIWTRTKVSTARRIAYTAAAVAVFTLLIALPTTIYIVGPVIAITIVVNLMIPRIRKASAVEDDRAKKYPAADWNPRKGEPHD